MDYFEKVRWLDSADLNAPWFTINREVTYLKPLNPPVKEDKDPKAGYDLTFETYADAFRCFERMYQMDRASWLYLQKHEFHNVGFFDESKDVDSYTFVLNDRMLTVRLSGVEYMARCAFKLQKKGEQDNE